MEGMEKNNVFPTLFSVVEFQHILPLSLFFTNVVIFSTLGGNLSRSKKPHYCYVTSLKTYHGQCGDEGVNVCLLGGLHHFVHGGLPRVVAVPDVLGQGAVEQDGLLRDDTHAGSNPWNVEGLDVVIVHSLESSKVIYVISGSDDKQFCIFTVHKKCTSSKSGLKMFQKTCLMRLE